MIDRLMKLLAVLFFSATILLIVASLIRLSWWLVNP